MKYQYGVKCIFCGKIFIYTNKKPAAGKQIKASDFYFKNGSQPLPNSPIICNHCDMGQETLLLSNLVVIQ